MYNVFTDRKGSITALLRPNGPRWRGFAIRAGTIYVVKQFPLQKKAA